jgi:hypothetical protein
MMMKVYFGSWDNYLYAIDGQKSDRDKEDDGTEVYVGDNTDQST